MIDAENNTGDTLMPCGMPLNCHIWSDFSITYNSLIHNSTKWAVHLQLPRRDLNLAKVKDKVMPRVKVRLKVKQLLLRIIEMEVLLK